MKHPVTGLFLVGSDVDPFQAELLAGAVDHASPDFDVALAVRIPHLSLSQSTERAFGDLLHQVPPVDPATGHTAAGTIAQAAEAAWQAGHLVAVWDAPAQLTLLHTEAEWMAGGPVLDVRVIDRALNPDRVGRRTIQSTAEFYDLIDPEEQYDDNLDNRARLLRMIAETMLVEHRELHQPVMDLMGQQRQWHVQQTDDLRVWLRKQRRPAAHLDPAWPLRVRDDRPREWAVVDDWLDGSGDAEAARIALRRIRSTTT